MVDFASANKPVFAGVAAVAHYYSISIKAVSVLVKNKKTNKIQAYLVLAKVSAKKWLFFF